MVLFLKENFSQCLFQTLDASMAPSQCLLWGVSNQPQLLWRLESEGPASWRSGGLYHTVGPWKVLGGGVGCGGGGDDSESSYSLGVSSFIKCSGIPTENLDSAAHTGPKPVGMGQGGVLACW